MSNRNTKVKRCFVCDEKAMESWDDVTFMRGTHLSNFCSVEHRDEYISFESTDGSCKMFDLTGYYSLAALNKSEHVKSNKSLVIPFLCRSCGLYHKVQKDVYDLYLMVSDNDIAQFAGRLDERLDNCHKSLSKSFPSEESAEFWLLGHHRKDVFNEVYSCECGKWHVGVIEDSDCPFTHWKKFDTEEQAAIWYKAYTGHKDFLVKHCKCGFYHARHSSHTCNTPMKLKHESFIEAEKHRMRLDYSDELHSYRCRCDKWHVGRLPFRKKREKEALTVNGNSRRRRRGKHNKTMTKPQNTPSVSVQIASVGEESSNSLFDFLSPEQVALLARFSE
jgi:hypothetical protein